MSIFNPLTWGDKAAENVLDKKDGLAVKFGGFVNDLHYSDAEKADTNLKITEFALTRLKLLEPFKIVQRIIAASTLFMWLFIGINLAVSIWVYAITKKVEVMCDIQGNNCAPVVTGGIDARTDFMQLAMSDYVFWPVVCVFTLYCGGGVVRYFRKDNQTD